MFLVLFKPDPFGSGFFIVKQAFLRFENKAGSKNVIKQCENLRFMPV
jgi:hypothetical protein